MTPSDKDLTDIENSVKGARCSYVGKCNSGRCPLHGREARVKLALVAEVRRYRALPVIEACSMCAYYEIGMCNAAFFNQKKRTGCKPRQTDGRDPPPKWCPIRSQP